MNWILFGFKGSGKTYFGQKLAALLEYPFLDTDQLIEKQEGLCCRDIALQKGEAYFREVESVVIKKLEGEGQVISLGGGAVLREENRKHLEMLGHLIYLRCPFSLLKQRTLTPPLPSFLDLKDPEGSFEKIYAERASLYEKIPSFTVEVGSMPDLIILERIIRADTS